MMDGICPSSAQGTEIEICVQVVYNCVYMWSMIGTAIGTALTTGMFSR